MANNFKKQLTQQRAAVPQVDPEEGRAVIPAPLQAAEPVRQETPQPATAQPPRASEPALSLHHITIVDTSEAPVNRGFFMYPSRHRQIAKDLAYLEDRKPWQIIEAALEEYVVRHYGKEYRRK
ncbi:MAG: hypothetical protein M3Y81_22095 [Chloroflexota bacterium]|nr:hypothetical protein [Chloroflexota bacterium]